MKPARHRALYSRSRIVYRGKSHGSMLSFTPGLPRYIVGISGRLQRRRRGRRLLLLRRLGGLGGVGTTLPSGGGGLPHRRVQGLPLVRIQRPVRGGAVPGRDARRRQGLVGRGAVLLVEVAELLQRLPPD